MIAAWTTRLIVKTRDEMLIFARQKMKQASAKAPEECANHYIMNAKRKYTLLFWCVFINISQAYNMATGVYRIFMSGRFNPISVEYFDRTSLCNFRTSITCIGVLKFFAERLQLNLFECLLLVTASLESLDRWIGSGVLSITCSSVIM